MVVFLGFNNRIFWDRPLKGMSSIGAPTPSSSVSVLEEVTVGPRTDSNGSPLKHLSPPGLILGPGSAKKDPDPLVNGRSTQLSSQPFSATLSSSQLCTQPQLSALGSRLSALNCASATVLFSTEKSFGRGFLGRQYRDQNKFAIFFVGSFFFLSSKEERMTRSKPEVK